MEYIGDSTLRASVPSRFNGDGMHGRSPIPIVMVVVTLYGISGGLLWCFGYNYDGVTGSAFTKIHPATYLIVAIYIWNAITYGNPVGYVIRGTLLRPGSVLLAAAGLTLFIQTVWLGAPGMAGDLDTFLAPALLVVLMIDLDERGIRHIEVVLHLMMTVNAVLALVEFLSGMHFFPYTLDGIASSDPRSSALQGHALENATMTAVYILALLSGSRSLTKVLRVGLIGLQFAALITFGGRVATIVSIVLSGLYLATLMHHTLRTQNVSILSAAATLLLMGLLPLLLVALWMSGFFDELMSRFFVDDGGSAAAREKMFSMFGSLSFRDWLFGPDPSLMNGVRRMEGLEWGIENPIVATILYHGLAITVLMIVAVSAFLREIARFCVPGVWLSMLSFVILLNASNSISTKATTLTKFAVMMLCLYLPQLRQHQNYGRSSWPGRDKAEPSTDNGGDAFNLPVSNPFGSTIRGRHPNSLGTTRRI